MKKYLTGIILSFLLVTLCSGQAESDSLLKGCMQTTGPASKYLKDFRIRLGEGVTGTGFRYKANLPLWKSTRYRFTMCTSPESEGQLILSIKDDLNRQVLSSFEEKSQTVYPYVEFVCNKSGIYKLYFDFTRFKSGSGVSIVSLVQ